MQPNKEFDKRKLLLEALSGNLANVMAYRSQIQRQHRHADLSQYAIRWVVDSRVDGGGMYLVDAEGAIRSISEDEFDDLPREISQRTWVKRDYTGGRRVPEPDEEY